MTSSHRSDSRVRCVGATPRMPSLPRLERVRRGTLKARNPRKAYSRGGAHRPSFWGETRRLYTEHPGERGRLLLHSCVASPTRAKGVPMNGRVRNGMIGVVLAA